MELKNRVELDQLNLLADELIQEILGNRNPFDTLTIVVPNLLVEQWFKSYWLKKTNKVLMNVKFTRMIPFLNQVFNPNNIPLFTRDKMTLAILRELGDHPENYPEIQEYYQNNTTNLYDLANKMSRIYSDYEKKCFTPGDWQGRLLLNIKGAENMTLSDVLENTPDASAKAYILGFTTIEPLYVQALNKLPKCKVYLQSEVNVKDEIEVICQASSKEREVEYVHDEICKIFKDNPTAKNYDFLVYAPNVGEYEGAIKKVFGTSGDKNFPEIPYVVVNTTKDTSNAGIVLEILYDILTTDQMNRNDLYRLLSNPNVQKARGIHPEKINDIITVLDKMNVYRNHELCDEWIYGIRRLLASKLIGDSSVDNSIFIGQEKCIPYGSISMDDATIEALASMIDDIEEFRKVYDHGDISLENLKLELDKWLSYSKKDEEETNYYYNAALNALELMMDAQMKPSIDIVFHSMMDATKNISVFPSNGITGGITFLNYSDVNILSSKYMFLMGMSSNNLPRKDIPDELLDKGFIPASKLSLDRKTFALLSKNAEHMYYSYVGINLKSLEEYSPSTLLPNALSTVQYRLSVTEEYASLFSKSEFRKKAYSNGLTSTEGMKDEKETLPLNAYPEALKYKELSSLISEGLMTKMNRLFSDHDDSIENSSKCFEPLFPDYIATAQIRKHILLYMIEKGSSDLDDAELEAIYQYYKDIHVLPYLVTGFTDVDKIKEFYDRLHTPFELKNPFEVLLNHESISWELNVTDYYIFAEDASELWFYDVKPRISDKNSKPSDFSRVYIISLAYLCKYHVNHPEREYKIHLNDYKSYICTPVNALEILDALYLEYNDYSHLVLSPMDNMDTNIFDSFIRVKGERGAWAYFEDADMVDVRENAGFDRDTFDEAIAHQEEFVKKYVLYESQVEEEEESNNGSDNE